MPLYNQPVHLEKLSLHTIGKYVSDLAVQLVTSALPSRSPDFIMSFDHTLQICQQLRNILHDMVPLSMADAITTELLRQLDDRYDDLREHIEYPSCRIIIQEIVKSIVHPKLKELVISWRWKYITDFVANQMNVLTKLNTLKYPNNIGRRDDLMINNHLINALSTCFGELLHLEKFVFHTICNDEILKALCDSCKQVKCLDIYLSFQVTDESIESILKLNNLEELDVTETGISDEGRQRLLAGLSRNKNKLKHYRCHCLENSELSVLSGLFPGLIEFSGNLMSSEASLVDFRKFNKLQILSIFNYSSDEHSDVLKYAGKHLQKLKLIGYKIDATDIAENCPVLQSLTIKAGRLQIADEPPVSFSSIKDLTIRTRCSAAPTILLSQCHNVTSLTICAKQTFFLSCLDAVLVNNQLRSLQQLCLGSLTGNVPPEALMFLTQHCANLKNCKVFGGQTVELKALYDNYPGVQVDANLWPQLADNLALVNRGREELIRRTCLMYLREFRSPYSTDCDYL